MIIRFMNAIGRRWLPALWLAMAAPLAAGAYPDKPVRLVVPFAAGGPADSLLRPLANELGKSLGQPVIIDNRPGASGAIGMDAVAKAAPDGYTIGYGNVGTLAINRGLYSKLAYNPDRDFAFIAAVLVTSNVLLVRADLPVVNVGELIALAKASPGKLTLASGGNGTTGHLSGELLKSMAQVDLMHVPYRGSPAALTELMGGLVDVMFDNLPTAVPHVRSGRLRALAVTSPRRSPLLPGVPTMAEAGLPGYESEAWGGIVAPAGVSPEVVKRLNADINRILATAEFRALYATLGAEVLGGTPADFAARVQREIPKWVELVKRSGAQVD